MDKTYAAIRDELRICIFALELQSPAESFCGTDFECVVMGIAGTVMQTECAPGGIGDALRASGGGPKGLAVLNCELNRVIICGLEQMDAPRSYIGYLQSGSERQLPLDGEVILVHLG